MREGEKSKTGPETSNGSVVRFVAMEGVGLSTDGTRRELDKSHSTGVGQQPTHEEAVKMFILVHAPGIYGAESDTQSGLLRGREDERLVEWEGSQ